MLNLPIAMKRSFAVCCLLLIIFLGFGMPSAAAQSYQVVRISSPQTGDIIQGQVSVIGTSQIDGFIAADVEFSYSGSNRIWYMLKSSQEAVSDGELAMWDTTTITDGDYILRLTVHLQDGRDMTYEVEDLRVRNYTAVTTPEAGDKEALSVGEQSSATTIPVTPTSRPTLPANQAAVTPVQFGLSIVQGMAITLVLFIGFGLYFFLRRRFIGH